MANVLIKGNIFKSKDLAYTRTKRAVSVIIQKIFGSE